MHNELLTLDKLAIRNPSLYKNHQKCVICLDKNENREHLFCCTGLIDLTNQVWQEAIIYFKEKALISFSNSNNKRKKSDLPQLIHRFQTNYWRK